MNQLHIDHDTITLDGFSNLSGDAFFVFRQSGLFISGSDPQTLSPSLHFQITNRKISSPDLAAKLSRYGFKNIHSFVSSGDHYYCVYPEILINVS